MANGLLNELYYRLKALSIQSIGPTVLFGRAKNDEKILKVIQFVESFSVLEDELQAKKLDIHDINELNMVFNGKRPVEVELGFAECLYSFSAESRPQAIECLNLIKRLYDEAALEFKEKLNHYAVPRL